MVCWRLRVVPMRKGVVPITPKVRLILVMEPQPKHCSGQRDLLSTNIPCSMTSRRARVCHPSLPECQRVEPWEGCKSFLQRQPAWGLNSSWRTTLTSFTTADQSMTPSIIIPTPSRFSGDIQRHNLAKALKKGQSVWLFLNCAKYFAKILWHLLRG